MASWQYASQAFGTLLASLFGIALTSGMPPADLKEWGWRLPFLFGVIIGPAGLYIRRHLEDAAPPPAAKYDRPIREVLLRQKLRMILALGALAIGAAIAYFTIYIPTYVVKTLGLPAPAAFTAAFAGSILAALLMPLAGILSDKIGRTTQMIAAAGVMLLVLYPAFLVLTNWPTPGVVIAVFLGLSILKALYNGPLPALMSELFPPATLATGLGLTYNLGIMLVGGPGPVTMAWLGGFSAIGGLAPAYYLMPICALSLMALIVIRRKIGTSIPVTL